MASWDLLEVAIEDCVHYCAFPYGKSSFNPYEQFIRGLAAGVAERQLKDGLLDFLGHYRPTDLASALGTATTRPIPLWLLPWKSWLKLRRLKGWEESPADVIDVMTGFSPTGIPAGLVRQEFAWLKRAWRHISTDGYRPSENSYIEVLELRARDSSRFLVLDGNHRVSALAALGQKRVVVRRRPWHIVRRATVSIWPLVLSRHIARSDALSIFDAYFQGNQNVFRAAEPAKFIEADGRTVNEILD